MDIYKRLKNRAKRDIDEFADNSSWGSFGKRSTVIEPMRIRGKKRIFIGNDVTILNQARMETIRSWGDKNLEGRLEIGDGTSFEQCCHLIAADKVIIGKGCVFSAFVYISDCSHGYSPETDIMKTALEIKPVKIGDHCFVGIGSCIMPGTTLGNNVVIGANSVVMGDIPDDSMAAGSPAKVIKRYDHSIGEWIRIENK